MIDFFTFQDGGWPSSFPSIFQKLSMLTTDIIVTSKVLTHKSKRKYIAKSHYLNGIYFGEWHILN